MVALVAVVAVATADNLLTNLALPEAWYVPARLTTTALVILLAVRVGGLAAADLGLARRDVASGLRWGGGAFAAVAAVYVVGLALPTTRDLYRDGRVADMSDATLWYTVLLAVPLGTVLAEEVLFRGAILGLGRARWGTAVGVTVSSVLFGLWHVAPGWEIYRVNPVLRDASTGVSAAPLLGVLAAVVSTTAAGLVLCFLRLRSRSLVAPILVHLATNDLGYVAAWWALGGVGR